MRRTRCSGRSYRLVIDYPAGTVELTLRPTATIAGRVIDENGRPVAGVEFLLACDVADDRFGIVVDGGYMARRLTPAENERDVRVNGYNTFHDGDGSRSEPKTNAKGEFRMERVFPGAAFDLYAMRYSPTDEKGSRSFEGMVKLTRATAKPGDAVTLGDLTLKSRPSEK